MSRRRLDVYAAFLETRVIPLFYTGDIPTAIQTVLACARGDARVVEFTSRGPDALAVFRDLAADTHVRSAEVILGAGSVPDAPTAALFLAAGAEFIVTPNLDPEIARLCNRRKVSYLPGCATVSEVALAEELGAEIVKLFPAVQLGGPDFIKAILGPRPWSLLMPTGGVDPDEASLRAWFAAGAACVGIGSSLVGRDVLIGGDFAGLESRVREACQIATAAVASKGGHDN